MTAPTTPPAGEEGEFNAARLREIHSFLLGEGPLDGRWFGDDPPVVNGRKQPYWWRSCLRAALLSSPSVEEVRREAIDALELIEVDLEAGRVTPAFRVKLALKRTKAWLAKLRSLSPQGG